jgi:hypothetical protein
MRSPSNTSVSVATDKPKLTVYVEPAVNDALQTEADKERRSKSQMAALLIEEALRARGHEFSSSSESQKEE